MKTPKSFLLALAMIMASAGFAAAQSSIEVKPGASRPVTNLINEQDNEIVNEVFSPITGRLNLTAAQKFRISNIATATMLQADPLFQQLDELDDQLSEAAFTGRLDEATIRQVSEKQAAVLGQIISMEGTREGQFLSDPDG
jgi:hypothetical protein